MEASRHHTHHSSGSFRSSHNSSGCRRSRSPFAVGCTRIGEGCQVLSISLRNVLLGTFLARRISSYLSQPGSLDSGYLTYTIRIFLGGPVCGPIRMTRCLKGIPRTWSMLDSGTLFLLQAIPSIPNRKMKTNAQGSLTMLINLYYRPMVF